MDLIQLNKIAVDAARAAGEIINRYKNEDFIVQKKIAGTSHASQVLTEIDKKCEAIIISHLSPSCIKNNIGLLSEERADDGSRFRQAYFWCIDPLDGTLAFINKQSGFSVSIALVSCDGIPYIGVVYDPPTDTLYNAIKGVGVYKNGKSFVIYNTNDYLTYVTDRELRNTPHRKTVDHFLSQQVDRLMLKGMHEISGGGAVKNAILVLENGPACMMKLPKAEDGGGSIWDYAATACIYSELGLPARNYINGVLDLNRKESTFMNHEGVFYSNF